jgi:hypothetical protein
MKFFGGSSFGLLPLKLTKTVVSVDNLRDGVFYADGEARKVRVLSAVTVYDGQQLVEERAVVAIGNQPFQQASLQ